MTVFNHTHSEKEVKAGDIFLLTSSQNSLIGKVLEVVRNPKNSFYNQKVSVQIYPFPIKEKKEIPIEKLVIENAILPLVLVDVDLWENGHFTTVDNVKISKKELSSYSYYHEFWEGHFNLEGFEIQKKAKITADYECINKRELEELIQESK